MQVQSGMPEFVLAGTKPVARRWTVLGQVLAGAGLIALAAQIRLPVPGSPVPMTLQSLGVLVVALAMPGWRSVGSALAYVACGSWGLPVFAAGSLGLAGLTGGYLIGFPIACLLIQFVAGAGRRTLVRSVFAAVFGIMAVLLCGSLWLIGVFGMSASDAFRTGMAPFVLKGLVEAILAAFVITCAANAGSALRRRISLLS